MTNIYFLSKILNDISLYPYNNKMSLFVEFNIPSSSYVLYISTSEDTISFTIEDTQNETYWKSSLSSNDINTITSKVSSALTLKEFSNVINIAKNDKTITFKSLSEISNDESQSKQKEYLLITKGEMSYPIKMKMFDKPDAGMYKLTINRLKRLNENNKYEKECTDLKNKIKILESQRPKGAVETDNLIVKYNELMKEYEALKKEREIEDNRNEIDDILKRIHKGNSTASTNNNFFLTGGGSLYENNNESYSMNEIDKLVNEIKILKENEKEYKDKINKLEKMLNSKSNQKQIYSYKKKYDIKPIKKPSTYSYTLTHKTTIQANKVKSRPFITNKKYLPPIKYTLLKKQNMRSQSFQNKRKQMNTTKQTKVLSPQGENAKKILSKRLRTIEEKMIRKIK